MGKVEVVRPAGEYNLNLRKSLRQLVKTNHRLLEFGGGLAKTHIQLRPFSIREGIPRPHPPVA